MNVITLNYPIAWDRVEANDNTNDGLVSYIFTYSGIEGMLGFVVYYPIVGDKVECQIIVGMTTVQYRTILHAVGSNEC